jgi:hypothetical protein
MTLPEVGVTISAAMTDKLSRYRKLAQSLAEIGISFQSRPSRSRIITHRLIAEQTPSRRMNVVISDSAH